MNRERLEEIIHNNHGEGNTLPFLNFKSEDSFLKEVMTKFGEKLAEMFKSNMNLSKEDLRVYLQIILIIISFTLAYLIYRKIKNKSFLPARKSPKDSTPNDIPKTLLQQLEEALQGKNFAKAARLSWKIFIKRKKLALSTTPQQLLKDENKNLSKIYSLMFDKNFDQSNIGEDWKWLENYLNNK